MSWRDNAACKGLTDLFFGTRDEAPQVTRRRVAAAKAVCAECPVILECDNAGERERFGVWARRTETDRKRNVRFCSVCDAEPAIPRRDYCNGCAPAPVVERPVAHGTRSCYRAGCLRDECREAAMLYARERKRIQRAMVS